MSQTNSDSGFGGLGLAPWDFQRYLRAADSFEVRCSRGFLRSRPDKWFPGFSAQWLPLVHSLGIEAKVVELKQGIGFPKGFTKTYVGTVDDEPIIVAFDDASADALASCIVPGGITQASSVVLEYLARRFLTSLALSWSGPESSVVRFEPESKAKPAQVAAHIKFVCNVNAQLVSVCIGLGKIVTERLDGLWRRQLRAATKSTEGPVEVALELAQLAVAPSMLAEYVKPGAIIDLEVALGDSLILRVGSGASAKAWLAARMLNVGGNLGFEVQPGPALLPPLPEGTTRLSIEFGSLQFEPGVIPEVSQVGAMWETSVRLGDKVRMSVNAEQVAEATLCSYEGRFAVSVG
jgi:hypothetical protein